jgi:hypothetical protein
VGKPTGGPPPLPFLAVPSWLSALVSAPAADPALYGPPNPPRPGGSNRLGGKDVDLSLVPRANHGIIPEGYDWASGTSLEEYREAVHQREYARLYALEEDELAVLIPGYRPLGVGRSPYIEEDAAALARLQGLAAYSALVHTLNPEGSRRYQEESLTTGGTKYKCNVFATDLVNNLPHGAYLPKLRYLDPAGVADGSAAAAAKTVAVGPDGVNGYLHGPAAEAHGWVRIEGKAEADVRTLAQEHANAGRVVVASGGGTPENIGHLAVIAPEALAGRGAARDAEGRVTRNVGSQAGLSGEDGVVPFGSLDIFRKDGADHHYSNPGIWYYDPDRDTRARP